MIYSTRAYQMGYGRPIGVLMLAENIPYPPGTPGNPTTFNHPVIYEIVEGVEIASLKQLNEPDSLSAFIAAGQRLVDKGVVAITGNCGLMIVHQAGMAQALPVPVLMSSLLQLALHPAADRTRTIGRRYRFQRERTEAGTSSWPAVGRRPILRLPRCRASRTSVPRSSRRPGYWTWRRSRPKPSRLPRAWSPSGPMSARSCFECTDLCPYASAVQDATGLPVFDVTTLINHALLALVRRPFSGIY